jgi:VanZ family protein
MNKKRWVVFLWALLILVIMGIPGNYFPQTTPFIKLFSPDKIIHLCLFAPFSFFLLNSFTDRHSSQNIFSRHNVLTFILGTVYAFLTELLQFFVFVGRNGNYVDAIADIIGVIIGIVFFSFWRKRKSHS